VARLGHAVPGAIGHAARHLARLRAGSRGERRGGPRRRRAACSDCRSAPGAVAAAEQPFEAASRAAAHVVGGGVERPAVPHARHERRRDRRHRRAGGRSIGRAIEQAGHVQSQRAAWGFGKVGGACQWRQAEQRAAKRRAGGPARAAAFAPLTGRASRLKAPAAARAPLTPRTAPLVARLEDLAEPAGLRAAARDDAVDDPLWLHVQAGRVAAGGARRGAALPPGGRAEERGALAAAAGRAGARLQEQACGAMGGGRATRTRITAHAHAGRTSEERGAPAMARPGPAQPRPAPAPRAAGRTAAAVDGVGHDGAVGVAHQQLVVGQRLGVGGWRGGGAEGGEGGSSDWSSCGGMMAAQTRSQGGASRQTRKRAAPRARGPHRVVRPAGVRGAVEVVRQQGDALRARGRAASKERRHTEPSRWGRGRRPPPSACWLPHLLAGFRLVPSLRGP
jgi:hypothetical protein